jgi:hypothetical protein
MWQVGLQRRYRRARIHDAARLMAELSPILRANTIILEIGINDAITTQKRSDTIRADFERLVRLAKDTGAEVFTSTVGPVDITKPDGCHRSGRLPVVEFRSRRPCDTDPAVNAGRKSPTFPMPRNARARGASCAFPRPAEGDQGCVRPRSQSLTALRALTERSLRCTT